MANITWSEKQVQLVIAMAEDSASQNIKYDWAAIAKKLGYSHGGSACTQWWKMKEKMKAANGDSGPSTPKIPRKRKADQGDGEDTPKKSAKKNGRGKKVEDEAANADEVCDQMKEESVEE